MWEIPRSQATLLVQATTMTGYCLEILCSKMVIDFRCLRVFLFLAPKNLRNFTARKQTKKKTSLLTPETTRVEHPVNNQASRLNDLLRVRKGNESDSDLMSPGQPCVFFGFSECKKKTWVVATQIFFDFHPESWGNDPILLFFQMG